MWDKLYSQSGTIGVNNRTKALVVGEVLWDVFPNYTRLGGAPLNFAAHVNRLKHDALLISAVGDDELGGRARRQIADLGLDTSLLKTTSQFETGTAFVQVGPSGETSFVIRRPAAYDLVELSQGDVLRLADWNPAWLYHGTLFAAAEHGKTVLCQLFRALPEAHRFYDLNLRPGFSPAPLVMELLAGATVVKLNEEELAAVHQFTGLPCGLEAFCLAGAERYGWKSVCVTLGERGCAILSDGEYVESWGIKVDVADTVGAGDAFAAAVLHGLIQHWPAGEIAALANRVGALVASRHGAIPDWDLEEAAALAYKKDRSS
jgi:fructokinase